MKRITVNDGVGSKIWIQGTTYLLDQMPQERMLKLYDAVPAIRKFFTITEDPIDESDFFTPEEFEQAVKATIKEAGKRRKSK